jgi:hypothetical protein
MNKNRTPTQLMIEAASLHAERERAAHWQHGVEELARVIAETLMAQMPRGVEGELSTWLRTSEGTRALRESWPKAVEAYLTRRAVESDLTL